jgi:hypothetical protein
MCALAPPHRLQRCHWANAALAGQELLGASSTTGTAAMVGDHLKNPKNLKNSGFGSEGTLKQPGPSDT